MDSYVGRKEKQHSVKTILVCGCRKYPPGHHGREGVVHLLGYSSISIFSSDLSSTVKWSSQTVIRSSQRFTRASSMYFSFRRILLMVLVHHFVLPAPVRMPSASRPFYNPIHRIAFQVFPVDALYHSACSGSMMRFHLHPWCSRGSDCDLPVPGHSG